MSGHTYVGSGDGPPRDQKPEGSRVITQAQATAHTLPQSLTHPDVLKGTNLSQVGMKAVCEVLLYKGGYTNTKQKCPQLWLSRFFFFFFFTT